MNAILRARPSRSCTSPITRPSASPVPETTRWPRTPTSTSSACTNARASRGDDLGGLGLEGRLGEVRVGLMVGGGEVDGSCMRLTQGGVQHLAEVGREEVLLHAAAVAFDEEHLFELAHVPGDGALREAGHRDE